MASLTYNQRKMVNCLCGHSEAHHDTKYRHGCTECKCVWFEIDNL